MNIYIPYLPMHADPVQAKILLQKSSYLYRKYYDNVYLVTNSATQDSLKNENLYFTKIFNILDNVPKENIQKAYAVVKLYTIKYFAEREEHACLSDFDFFIFEPFQKKILEADVFCQSLEYGVHNFYRTYDFVLHCKNKYLAQKASISKHNQGINCGIVGGRNYSFLYKYANTAIQMLEDAENLSFWGSRPSDINSLQVEQYYMYLALLEEKINFELVYPNSNPESRLYGINYTFESLVNECSCLPYNQRDCSLFLHTLGSGKKINRIEGHFPNGRPSKGLAARMSNELLKLDYFK